jgi:N-acyl-D-aspartate/D-glutamate deacylase
LTTAIVGGLVVDGTGGAPTPADVLIRGDRIVRVAPPAALGTEGIATKIVATGKAVCPGFIDVHAHDDLAVFEHPGLEFKLSQGVTTEIVGNCGLGVAPLTDEMRADLVGSRGFLSAVLGPSSAAPWTTSAEYANAIREDPPALNVGILAPHSAIRRSVVGADERPASVAELDRMRHLVEDAMDAGALGMSTGLAYSPGRAADTAEVVALASVMAERGGVYATHIRDESDAVHVALDEALAIGDRAGCRVHISHLKAFGRANWGKVDRLLARIDDADASCDVYPYTAASTFLADAMNAGSALTPIQPEDITIASARGAEDVVGRSLDEIARVWSVTPDEAVRRILDVASGRVSVVYFGMSEDDVATVVRHERSVFGSDGLPTLEGAPHPRLFGTFPKVIREFVATRRDLSLAEMARKAAAVPARIFGIADRGHVAEGAFADIVILDPSRVRDNATYAEPKRIASGIDVVFVNGTVAWRNGAPTGGRAGRLIRLP